MDVFLWMRPKAWNRIIDVLAPVWVTAVKFSVVFLS